MGQRLNITITRKEKTIANSYHHWAGFTSSAVGMCIECIHSLITNRSKFFNLTDKEVQMLAVSMLESTGAGLDTDDYNSLNVLERRQHKKEVDRNSGIIAISPEKINQLESYADEFVFIELGENANPFAKDFVIDFEVLSKFDIDEYCDAYSIKPSNISKIPKFDKDIESLTFNDFINLAKFLENNPSFFVKNDNEIRVEIS